MSNNPSAFYQARYATAAAGAGEAWTTASPVGSAPLIQGHPVVVGHQLISSVPQYAEFLGASQHQAPNSTSQLPNHRQFLAHVTPAALAATAYVQAQVKTSFRDSFVLLCLCVCLSVCLFVLVCVLA